MADEVADAEFEAMVDEALDRIPPVLAELVTNVVVLIEAEPPPDDRDLLGLYDGVDLTRRDSSYAGVLPDRITLFRGPLLRLCETRDQLRREIEITVVHEVGHHFGIDDDRLHELGYS